ncbi:MAG: GNAT family N-acetyltransferase [Alphaproteobacteria bacterium]
MSDFEICYLADKKEFVEACAAWAYGRWGVQVSDGSFERAFKRFSECAQKNKLPFTLIALDKNKRPAAMASLWEQDGEIWQEQTPWIAAVYTLYRYRGNGLAKKLISRLEEEAVKLGFKEIYLHSESTAGYYPQLGYQKIETVKDENADIGETTLFKKILV